MKINQKSKIGIDIDEVVTQTITSLLKYINNKRGTNYSFDKVTNYSLWKTEIHNSKEESIKEFEEFQFSENFDNLPLIEFAKESLEKLKKSYELIFITARPSTTSYKTSSFFKNLFPEDDFEIIYSGGIYGGKTKGEICKELGIDFFIEDNMDYALGSAKKGIKTFLFDKPWNRNYEKHENIVKVNNWNEILEKLE